MIITNSRYALVGYFITSYPTRAHGIIVNSSLISNGYAINNYSTALNPGSQMMASVEPLTWYARSSSTYVFFSNSVPGVINMIKPPFASCPPGGGGTPL